MLKILMLTLLLTAASVGGQTIVLDGEDSEGCKADVDCVFLTRGPKEYGVPEPSPEGADVCEARGYRVAFCVSEIYYSLWVEELSYEGVECDYIEIVKAWFIGDIGSGESYVEFDKWESWNTFVVRWHRKSLRIEILGDGKFEATTIDSTGN